MYKALKCEKKNRIYVLTLLILGIVFFFCIGESGPVLGGDSAFFLALEGKSTLSYWLYPRFLQMCKIIFGEVNFLDAVHFIQGLLAIVSSVAVAEFCREKYQLNYICATIIYCFTFLPYGYSLPENVVSHHILTEGLAFPIFALYMLAIIKMFLYEKKQYIFESFILSVILILLRLQLLVMLLVFGISLFVLLYKKIYSKVANEKKVWFISASIGIGCVTLIGGIILFFNILLSGKMSQFSDAITGRVLCLMEYEDRELFEGETREVYDVLYENARNKGTLLALNDAKRADDISHSINENTKDWFYVIDDYYNEKYSGISESDKMYKYRMRDAIVWDLIQEHTADYVVLTMKLLPHSFVASIFIQPDEIYELCHIIAFGFYISAVLLIIYAIRKKRCVNSFWIPLAISLFVIGVNVIATNIFFYGQQRYVVYAFGFFYLSYILLLIGLWKNGKQNCN